MLKSTFPSPSNSKHFQALILLLQLCILVKSQNIVCNPGFDDYVNFGYKFVASNSSCWYESKGGVFQVKNEPPVGCIAEIVSNVSYSLCQMLHLQPDQDYELTFDSYNTFYINYSLVGVNLTNTSIYKIQIYKQQKGAKGKINFTAKYPTQELCFIPERYSVAAGSSPGPCIDNVTVTKINQTVEIMCAFPSYENLQKIRYKCNYNDSRARDYLQRLSHSKSFHFKIQEQLQQKYQVRVMNNQQIQITLHPQKTFSIKNVSFGIQSNLSTSFSCKKFNINFIVLGASMLFSKLSDSQAQNLQGISQFSLKVLKIEKNIYQFLRLTFFSYFLLSIFSFWNLSLMYNFLRISTVPHFCKFIIQKFIKTFFQLGSVMSWLKNSVYLLQSIDLSYIGGRQLIQENYEGESWLGHFDISSGFLKNNSEAILILSGVTIKIMIILLINYLKPSNNFLSFIIPKNKRLLKIFLLEIMSYQIFMTLSSGSCLIKYGFENWKDLSNNFVQVLTFWTAIVILPLYFFVEIGEKEKKWKTELRKSTTKFANKQDRKIYVKKFLKHFQKKVFRTSLNTILEFLNYLTIPFIIIFKNDAIFLLLNGIVILIRCWCFIGYNKYFLYTCRQKVFYALNILIWLMYHCIYVIFWAIEYNLQSEKKVEAYQKNIELSTFSIVGGYAILTIILGGGFIQMVDFLINFVFFLYKKVKKISKRIKSNNIVPVPSKIHNQQQKENKRKIQNNSIEDSSKQQKMQDKQILKIIQLNEKYNEEVLQTVKFQEKPKQNKLRGKKKNLSIKNKKFGKKIKGRNMKKE